MTEEVAPQDLAPATAQSDISIPPAQELEFDGGTYMMDYSRLDDIEVLEAFQGGGGVFGSELNGMMTALQKVMGDDYHKFKQDQIKKYGVCKATTIAALFNMTNKKAGGNS